MNCTHLVPAQKIEAFYSKAQATLTVSAEVTIGPGSYGVQICRSLLDASTAATPSFVVSAPAPEGIQPDYVLVTTISASFSFERAPTNALVYSAGSDAPTRAEVKVSDTPAPAPAKASGTTGGGAAQATSASPMAASAPLPGSAGTAAGALQTVIGWSREYDYDAALADAISQLRKSVGTLNPDVGVNATVVESGVALGGFRAKTGLYIKLQMT